LHSVRSLIIFYTEGNFALKTIVAQGLLLIGVKVALTAPLASPSSLFVKCLKNV